MSDPTLSQLLTAFRSGDHVDAKNLADAITAMTQGQDDLLKRLLGDIGLLAQRLARLERIVSGNDTPEDLVEPRPQAKLGDEFPTVEPTPAEQDAIVEGLFARAVGTREVKPLRSPVRVDSLKVGERCWTECKVGDSHPNGVWVTIGTTDVFVPREHVVLPVEASAKVETTTEVPVVPNDTGNSGGSASLPAPIQLRVGHRYRRRDGVETVCIGHYTGQFREFQFAPDDDSTAYSYRANGIYFDDNSDFDIVADLGPVKMEESKLRPAWATDGDATFLREALSLKHVASTHLTSAANEFWRRVYAARQQIARDMLAELGVKP